MCNVHRVAVRLLQAYLKGKGWQTSVDELSPNLETCWLRNVHGQEPDESHSSAHGGLGSISIAGSYSAIPNEQQLYVTIQFDIQRYRLMILVEIQDPM